MSAAGREESLGKIGKVGLPWKRFFTSASLWFRMTRQGGDTMTGVSNHSGGADFKAEGLPYAQRVVEIFTKLRSKDLAEAQAVLKVCEEGRRQQIDNG